MTPDEFDREMADANAIMIDVVKRFDNMRALLREADAPQSVIDLYEEAVAVMYELRAKIVVDRALRVMPEC